MDAVDLYTLPNGWLPCDACARPIPASRMAEHIGSTACEHEQHDGKVPPGWAQLETHYMPGYGGSGLAVTTLKECRAPLFRMPVAGKATLWFAPPWVLIIAQADASAVLRQEAIKRSRMDHEYRAQVLAGLRLVNAGDREVIETILQGAPD